jgi:hypothetical protein
LREDQQQTACGSMGLDSQSVSKKSKEDRLQLVDNDGQGI